MDTWKSNRIILMMFVQLLQLECTTGLAEIEETALYHIQTVWTCRRTASILTSANSCNHSTTDWTFSMHRHNNTITAMLRLLPSNLFTSKCFVFFPPNTSCAEFSCVSVINLGEWSKIVSEWVQYPCVYGSSDELNTHINTCPLQSFRPHMLRWRDK